MSLGIQVGYQTEKYVFRNTSRLSNSIDPNNAQHFSLNLALAVEKVISKQLFDAL